MNFKTLLPTFCAFASFSLTEAHTLTTVNPGTPQIHPDSYGAFYKTDQVNRTSFVKLVGENKKLLNQHIPVGAPKGCMRLATFNVSKLFNRFEKKSTLDLVKEDITQIMADVILFQEVNVSSMSSLRQSKFGGFLKGMGYEYFHFGAKKNAKFGNLIASLYPLREKGAIDPGDDVLIIDAALDIKGGSSMVMFNAQWGTHTDASNKQAALTVNYVKKKCSEAGINVPFLLGGDLNAIKQGSKMKSLINTGALTNSFDALEWQCPTVTNIDGRALDFLLAGERTKENVVGSYVYYTDSSEHLPIITDLNVEPVCLPSGTKQIHPKSYATLDNSDKSNHLAFVNVVKNNQNLNKHIPQLTDDYYDGFRVVTYNVNKFKHRSSRNSVLPLLRDFEVLAAPVLLLQDVPESMMDGHDPEFFAVFENNGYDHLHFGAGNDGNGVLIASLHPLHNKDSFELGDNHVIISSEIRFENGEKFTLFNTLWDHDNPDAREKQAELTVKYIKSKCGTTEKFLLGGHFNATWSEKPIQTLAISGLMITPFDALDWQRPNLTSIDGRAIDFLWAGNQLQYNIEGTYVFYTDNTDYFPIVVDLDLHRGDKNTEVHVEDTSPPKDKIDTPPKDKTDTPPKDKTDTPPKDETDDTPPKGKITTPPIVKTTTPPSSTYTPPSGGIGSSSTSSSNNSGGGGSKKSSSSPPNPSPYSAPKTVSKNPGSSANSSVIVSLAALFASLLVGLAAI